MTNPANVPSRTVNALCIEIWAAVLMAAPALAETQVRGSLEAVTVEAKNSSVEEILAALGRAFNIRHQSSARLDKQRSGTYAGSLSQVVSRVLEGYNFVLKTENGHTVVTVLGASSAAQAAPTAPGAASTPETLPAPVLPPSGPGPTPIIGRGQSTPPVPAPPAPGSAAIPVPVPGPAGNMPPFTTEAPARPPEGNR
jgi:hypothetical protein